MADTLRFVADRGDALLRLDQVLVRRVVDVSRMSRSLAQQWIESGLIAVDGKIARRSSTGVREGARVEVMLPASTVRRLRPEGQPGDLDVLFEDDCLIAINKLPGIVVHPSYKQASGTLLNAVLWRLRDRTNVRPGILTRLDKDTSGLVLVALTGEAQATVQRDAAAGRVKKEYLAVVCGVPRPRTGRIELPLARDPLDRRRVVVTPGGAASETRYELVASSRGTSLIRCHLVTGRTHQIRVHLSANGWPIVGDRLYGEPHPEMTRQALHAWRIALPHPVTRQALNIEAPLSQDMEKLIALQLNATRRPGRAEVL